MKLTNEEIEMQNNTDVLGYIREQNEAYEAECKQNGSTFYMLVSEHIADDYANVYEYEKSMAYSCYSDIYKDRNGFRPRLDWHNMTLAQIEQLLEEI